MRRVLPLSMLALAGCGAAESQAPRPGPVAAGGTGAIEAVLPSPPAAAEPARPRGRWATARVISRTALRARPGGRRVATLGRRTEFGSERWVSVVGRRGRWLRVIVPERLNGRPGWIPAAATRAGATDLSLHIDRSARRLLVRDGPRVLQRVRIGVGAPDHPTPTGRFAVTDKLLMGGPGTTYGCCAIALSAHQPDLPPGWPGLDRIAVHGTQSPATIGQPGSLGCMHASEADLQRLMRTVPLGAPVFIRA